MSICTTTPKEGTVNLLESLKPITPPSRDSREKFSFNLARWVKKHGRHGPLGARIFFTPRIWGKGDDVFDPLRTQPHHMAVGIYYSDGAPGISGSRLSSVLCMGAREQPVFFIYEDPQDVTDIWLPAYLERGKCAIDPEHNSLYNERDRFDVASDEQSRVCRWCGQTFTRKDTPRTVIDTTWDPACERMSTCGNLSDIAEGRFQKRLWVSIPKRHPLHLSTRRNPGTHPRRPTWI